MADSPPRGDPPYVPIRHTRWPVRRTPRSLFLVGLALLVAVVLVGLAHRPSTAQQSPARTPKPVPFTSVAELLIVLSQKH